MNDAEIRARVDAVVDWTTEKRRALHRIPEPGFKEFKTQAVINAALDEIGVEYQCERTWTVGLIRGAHPGKTVALRADIDALPITEEGDLPFKSEHPGWMHACGHDAHAAIQLGVARVLAGARDELHGNVKLLFQPAEEGPGGAKPMAEAGVLENPHVDAAYGLHVAPALLAGTMEWKHGAMNASSNLIRIIVRGRGGHGAYPDLSRDAIVCSAYVISALQTIVSRNISPLDSAVISICKISGGTADNIICGEVEMEGTLRTSSGELRDLMVARIKEVAVNTAKAMGCECDASVIFGYPPLVNDAACISTVARVGARLLGAENVSIKPTMSMGGEDFPYFTEKIPGAFYNIGSSGADHPFAPLHNARFYLDERCLRTGVLAQVGIVLEELGAPCA